MPARDGGGLSRLEEMIFIKAHVQGRNGVPGSVSAFDAYLGFRDMGFEVEVFDDPASLQGAPRGDVVVGGVGVIRARLRELGVDCPSINYPEELKAYLGRRVWRSTIDQVSCDVESWPLFVKPVEEKRFTSCVVESTADLVGKDYQSDNFEVICSDAIDMLSGFAFVNHETGIGDANFFVRKHSCRQIERPSVLQRTSLSE